MAVAGEVERGGETDAGAGAGDEGDGHDVGSSGRAMLRPEEPVVKGARSRRAGRSAERGAEHEIAVLVDRRGPARVHKRARVGLLDDRGAVDDVAAEELAAIEHPGRAKATHLGEPDVAT